MVWYQRKTALTEIFCHRELSKTWTLRPRLGRGILKGAQEESYMSDGLKSEKNSVNRKILSQETFEKFGLFFFVVWCYKYGGGGGQEKKIKWPSKAAKAMFTRSVWWRLDRALLIHTTAVLCRANEILTLSQATVKMYILAWRRITVVAAIPAPPAQGNISAMKEARSTARILLYYYYHKYV